VVVARRRILAYGPAEPPHPLDTPVGILTVLCVAATLGAALTMIT
jgi:hypothetical protein